MTSLDFLYIALGGSAILLTIFLCVLLLYTILIVRDGSKMAENLKISSEKIKDAVLDPLKTLSEFSTGFAFIQTIFEKVKQRFGMEMEDQPDQKQSWFKVKKIKK